MGLVKGTPAAKEQVDKTGNFGRFRRTIQQRTDGSMRSELGHLVGGLCVIRILVGGHDIQVQTLMETQGDAISRPSTNGSAMCAYVATGPMLGTSLCG
jgi:hypothetical protein